MNAQEVAQILGSQDITGVEAALAHVDQAAIYADELGALVAYLWDKTSPINGCPAETLLERPDVAEANAVYLIRDTRAGQVLYVQPHAPDVEGHVLMTPDQALAYAATHRELVAQRRAEERTLGLVAAQLSPPA